MLLESSGYERLDEAAAAWVVRHWRYEPAMEGGRAIESRVEAVLTFRLE
jgi:outer membrane biosynthesis protein TonB